MITINSDAFSSGQISSKLWLCDKLENIGWQSHITHIYGGWYGMLAFLLLSRNKFNVDRIKSYDIDPTCESIADTLNENWVWQNWKFKAFTENCNSIDPSDADLTINTSTEHFESSQWFENLPKGRRVVLQSNNMQHDDHHSLTSSIDEFVARFPLSKIHLADSLEFVYPDWKFTRFMLIGLK